MKASKRKKLESKGWRIGDAKDFLSLSEQEAEFIELKLKLAEILREKRIARHMGQTKLAELVKSSQSRVAKMEAADSSVSLDLLVKTLIALGTSGPELGRMLSGNHRPTAVH